VSVGEAVGEMERDGWVDDGLLMDGMRDDRKAKTTRREDTW
jgi:hypothetical protein